MDFGANLRLDAGDQAVYAGDHVEQRISEPSRLRLEERDDIQQPAEITNIKISTKTARGDPPPAVCTRKSFYQTRWAVG